MNDLTKKCIQDHRNPIVKLSLPIHKLFLAAKTEEQKKLVNDHQEQFRTILEHQRIEKRSGRAQAVWLPKDKIAKVTKVVKNLVKYFGFQNRDGIFLYPEEMLFLLETNRLEVTFEKNIFSIEKAYQTVLTVTDITLLKYRVYKKLALLGYKLIRSEQLNKKVPNRDKKNEAKRALEDKSTAAYQPAKRVKGHGSSENSVQSDIDSQHYSETENIIHKEAEHVYNILNGIRRHMPRDCNNEINNLKTDYSIFTPTNLSKHEPDFNLYICEADIPDQKKFNCKVPSIFASCTDDVAFYRFGNVHLPYI